MLEWSLKIIRAENGFILESQGEIDQGLETNRTVIEEQDEDELRMYQELLHEVLEYFGYYGSKHDGERLMIQRVKQDE